MLHLDLDELRVRLDQMTERIVSRVKDRSRFLLNASVYEEDAIEIKGRRGISFLDFALEGLEAYHSSLGRYDYPDQYPILIPSSSCSPVARVIGKPHLPPLRISIAEDLLAFYKVFLRQLCTSGDDPDTYGETAYVDSDLLQLLNERINVGRYVAQAKVDRDPTIIGVISDNTQLAARLRDPIREDTLIEAARRIAIKYELDPRRAEQVFRWVIEKTLAVEIEYLRQLPTVTID